MGVHSVPVPRMTSSDIHLLFLSGYRPPRVWLSGRVCEMDCRLPREDQGCYTMVLNLQNPTPYVSAFQAIIHPSSPAVNTTLSSSKKQKFLTSSPPCAPGNPTTVSVPQPHLSLPHSSPPLFSKCHSTNISSSCVPTPTTAPPSALGTTPAAYRHESTDRTSPMSQTVEAAPSAASYSASFSSCESA